MISVLITSTIWAEVITAKNAVNGNGLAILLGLLIGYMAKLISE